MGFPEYTPTIPVLIDSLAQRFGPNELVVTERRRLTYAQAASESAQLARALLSAGVGKGTRLGLLMPNGPDWAIGWLAASRIGALLVPISTFYQARELGWVLRHADVRVLLTCDRALRHDYLARLEQVAPELERAGPGPLYLRSLPHLRAVYVWGEGRRAWARPAAELVPAEGIDDAFLRAVQDCVTPADLAVIVYSSGSTAEPKGAVHTQGTLVRHSYNLDQYRDFVASDRVYSPMPLFWVGGLVTSLLAVMHRGACLLCEDGFDPDRTLAFLEHERATMIGGWPAQVKAMAEHPRLAEFDFSSVRAGNLYEVMPPEAKPADPLLRCNSLGMTETCGPHTWGDMKVDLPERLRGSFGTEVPGTQHKIVDPQSGAALGPGERGEICVRGYSLMQGLYKREREQVFDADGYYHTGDSGYLNAEGHLFFEGRMGEMIKTAGANVAPREVELVLESYEDVRLAAVVGIPDPVRGQLVAAAVVPEDGCKLEPEALRERLRSELSSFKVPRHIFVASIGEMPLTDTGKVHKKQLTERLAQRLRQQAPRGQPQRAPQS
jgi:acyl-CoA synthetase (AMP-forming)/AMP-acid ligase II